MHYYSIYSPPTTHLPTSISHQTSDSGALIPFLTRLRLKRTECDRPSLDVTYLLRSCFHNQSLYSFLDSAHVRLHSPINVNEYHVAVKVCYVTYDIHIPSGFWNIYVSSMYIDNFWAHRLSMQIVKCWMGHWSCFAASTSSDLSLVLVHVFFPPNTLHTIEHEFRHLPYSHSKLTPNAYQQVLCLYSINLNSTLKFIPNNQRFFLFPCLKSGDIKYDQVTDSTFRSRIGALEFIF